MINRRQFLVAGVAGASGLATLQVGAGPQATEMPVAAGAAGLELSILPGRVYKRGSDRNRLRLDQWLFFLVLQSPQPKKPAFESLVVRYTAGGKTVQETTCSGTELAAMDLVPAVAEEPVLPVYRVAAFSIAGSLPQPLSADHAHCELRWRDAEGLVQRAEHDFPIETYTQKTGLIFPFRGRGIITQGGGWNDGHRNRSGMFAIDAVGLTERYAAMVAEGDGPEALAGWGREILAPAAGEVVVARGDRPDQPVTGVSDPRYFVPEHPQGGDPGNHCVIDHGNGEFSMLAHFQKDSLRVKVGDRVTQGQVLGKLGNSGDSDTPHVHHQLQSGPSWTTADALPHVYANGPGARHDRGEFFNAE